MGIFEGASPQSIGNPIPFIPFPLSPSPYHFIPFPLSRGRGRFEKRGCAPLRRPALEGGEELTEGLREAKPPYHIPPPLL